MSDAAIRIVNVTKRFGRTVAVDGLDLVVPRGTLCGFLGPNGAGKSTTIRMIMSIIYPDSGTIEVLGGSALGAKDRIGYLPEERGVYRKMRVGEFLHYMGRLKGLPGRGLRTTVERWLERVELPGVYAKRCADLSKGMQQKVQFIAALIHEPELLILDEPFSGLDPVNAELMRALVEELCGEGRTIIFSTHALAQAERLCDRIFLINHGVKLLDATIEEIRHTYDPRTLLVDPRIDPAEARALLSTLPTVVEAHLTASGCVELLLEESAEPQALMKLALDAVPARAVEVRRVSLEEVFVRLVRRGSQHPPISGGAAHSMVTFPSPTAVAKSPTADAAELAELPFGRPTP